MLLVKITVSSKIIEDVSSTSQIEYLEALGTDSLGCRTNVVMYSNVGDYGCERIVIEGVYTPNNNQKLLTKNEIYGYLDTLGYILSVAQTRYQSSEILVFVSITGINEAQDSRPMTKTTDNDISKRYIVVFNNGVIACFDTRDEVIKCLKANIERLSEITVFDKSTNIEVASFIG